MTDRWLLVDEIAIHLGVNPEAIYSQILWRRMPADKSEKLRKFGTVRVDQAINHRLTSCDFDTTNSDNRTLPRGMTESRKLKSVMTLTEAHPQHLPATQSGKVEPYSFSFITGALYVSESLAVAELVRIEPDWAKVLQHASQDNLLKQRKSASRTRLLREIRYRLQRMSREELDFLCKAGSRDQRLLLFVAVCRRFRFVREFVEEVLHPKAMALDHQLYPADFALFLDRKGAESPKLEKLTPKSTAKVKQVLTRMLAEAGLLDSTITQRIRRPLPSSALLRLIAKSDPINLRCLLLPDSDIRQLKH